MLRAAYVTLPIMAIPISYISLREFSANMIEKFTNKKRDSNWTYSIAALGPTGIVMGVASKSATGRSHVEKYLRLLNTRNMVRTGHRHNFDIKCPIDYPKF